MQKPKKWKMAIIIWIAIYPTITTIFLLFGKYLKQLPPPLTTLAVTLVAVPLMVFVLLPVLTKWFNKWLMK